MEKLSRRQFMALAGLSGTSLAALSLAWHVGASWWAQPAAPGWQVLSGHEVDVVGAIAEALFPGEKVGVDLIPSALDVGVPRFFDAFLATTLDDFTADALRLLIHAIDEVAVVADLGMARFHERPSGERVLILRAWEESAISARRGAFSALKLFLSMGYCEHPDIVRAVGISYACGEG